MLWPTAADALAWMQSRTDGSAQVLFRGQSYIYPTIVPSLLRDDICADERNRWWAVLRKFVGSRNGLTGYHIRSPHDAVAIVQHYLVRSPVLDVTGDSDVALYFATRRAPSKDLRVVYAVEIGALQAAGLRVTDHAFLALPLQNGGARHRWLRQDGFTVGASDWTDLDAARKLDFACLHGVERFAFKMLPDEDNLVSKLGDLEAIKGDPLAAQVRTAFESVARELGCLEVVERLMPTEGTVAVHSQLIGQIESLIEQAKVRGLSSDDISEIRELLLAAQKGHWDTSWNASLDYWTEKANDESAFLR